MRRRIVGALALAIVPSAVMLGQTPGAYIRVAIIKVKPEKRVEFDGLVKKMVDANRKNKGPDWLGAEAAYGEANTVYFSTVRPTWADMEKGGEAFGAALGKALGPAGVSKMMQDLSQCIASERIELRRIRPDLSSNAPSNQADLLKLVGQSRWVRTTIVRLRPGRLGDYQALARDIKAARDKRGGPPILVSQSVAGQTATSFYITSLVSSTAAFDNPGPNLPELLGEDGFRKYVNTNKEAVLSTETILNRYVPALSNPAEEVVAVAPDFWRPKPAAAPKPKAAEAPKTGQ